VTSQQSWPQPGWLSDLVEAAASCVPQPKSLRRPAEVVCDRRLETFPAGVHRRSGQAVAPTSLSFNLGILNRLRCVWYLHRRTVWQSRLCGCLTLDTSRFCVIAVTIVSIDGFCWNLVVCLQLDVALLALNSVIIRWCLLELQKCIEGVTFFPRHSEKHLSTVPSENYLMFGWRPLCSKTLR